MTGMSNTAQQIQTDNCGRPLTSAQARLAFRNNKRVQPTAGIAPGSVQANLAILPRDLAFDFLLFCQRNPKPCPIIEVLEAGQVEPVLSTPGADIRTDLPRYRIFHDGVLVEEPLDLKAVWQADLVTIVILKG